MIVAEGVSKFYGEHQALDRVSFEIKANEVVGFLGLNGAGKTTVLKILSGLLLPSTGRVQIDGLDILDQPLEVRRKIGFLPERPPLYDDMTVRQYLSYAGCLNGVSKQDIDSRVQQVIADTGLEVVTDYLIEWLSQGYRQRLGIAQAIVHQPTLVILDEPITGLDPKQIVGMRSLIRSLSERHTVLLSSHILGEISQTCDRLLVVHRGRLVAQGTEVELTSQAAAARVEVLASGSKEQVQQAVAAVEGVTDPRTEVGGDNVVRLTADVANFEVREEMVKALVGAGVGVRRFAEAETELESIFLQLTKSGASGIAPQKGGAS